MLKILFFICLFALVHSYLFYPLLMKLLAKGKSLNKDVYNLDELPKIAVVIAAYNEEAVLQAKLDSIVLSSYPKDKLNVYVGSDCSSDNTAKIATDMSEQFPYIKFIHFAERGGKSSVLNKLFANHISSDDYEAFVMTDANVIFEKDCLVELAKHFKLGNVGVVAANIVNTKVGKEGIGRLEQQYISTENHLKINEGLAFQSSIGAFGACYAIRPAVIREIPNNFLMEDFFLSMNAFNFDLQSIKNPAAIAYEDLPGSIEQEFKRKRRISSGNFQNLSVYSPLLWKFNKVSFAFFSHKVLRWLGPIFMFLGYFSLAIVTINNPGIQPYMLFFVVANAIILMAVVDIILTPLNIHVNLLRLARYFLAMNMALFLGMIDYITGVKTNIWKPTQRQE